MLRRFTHLEIDPKSAALGFLMGGLVAFFGGFFLTQTDHSLLSIVKEGYSNFGIELISIAVTVLVIDGLNQRREERRIVQAEKERLIRAAGSTVNDTAKSAVDEIDKRGWLEGETGILRGANLSGANLQNAPLWNNANFQSANLSDAMLQSTNLSDGILQSANLAAAKLQSADLSFANLQSAILAYANLQGANLGYANLQGAILNEAEFDENTILPDDTKWTPDTDMTRFTNPKHPNFWRSDKSYSPAYRGKSLRE